MNIKDVTASVNDDILLFQQKYKQVLYARNTLVDKVSRYVLKQQGKQIRPAMVLLAAKRTLPVEHLETPRQYGARWREAFRCRVDPNSPRGKFDTVYYIFDQDADYTWFMLRWG